MQIPEQALMFVELLGIGIIVLNILIATAVLLRNGLRGRPRCAAYVLLRSTLGCSILPGSELLIGGATPGGSFSRRCSGHSRKQGCVEPSCGWEDLCVR